MKTNKKTIVQKFEGGEKFWMSEKEFTGVIVGKDSTNSEYVISNGVIEPNGHIPDHYHKWEDQTFHVIEGELEAKIGEQVYQIGPGDSIQCPRGVSHYIKNVGKVQARLISYIFPGDMVEEFMKETHKQVTSGNIDFNLIEEKFGVVYL